MPPSEIQQLTQRAFLPLYDVISNVGGRCLQAIAMQCFQYTAASTVRRLTPKVLIRATHSGQTLTLAAIYRGNWASFALYSDLIGRRGRLLLRPSGSCLGTSLWAGLQG